MDAPITCMDSAHSRSRTISTEPKLCTLDYFIPSSITPWLIGKKGEELGVLLRERTLFSKEETEQRIQRMGWRWQEGGGGQNSC